ncbi:uncharacterized protein C8A04DRAFT_29893 [Dichotomopilus funicola]|uniref:Uncharacterized protein n=1 Tax=Dichotomopilus funicola TaxID=1934379 RepID=A0AAN6ZKB3_9PEZI|nr:hypothetical protein C8A04DRAFT_29893 [Dichotomopilus funicola]
MQLTIAVTILASMAASVSTVALAPKDTVTKYKLASWNPGSEIEGLPIKASKSQGRLQYFDNENGIPTQPLETTGWNLNGGVLYFYEAPFVACPTSHNGPYLVYLYTGTLNPDGHAGCLGFRAVITPETDPEGCTYSQ